MLQLILRLKTCIKITEFKNKKFNKKSNEKERCLNCVH